VLNHDLSLCMNKFRSDLRMITGFLCISYSAKNNYEENKVHTNFVGRVDKGQVKSESGLTLNLHVLSL